MDLKWLTISSRIEIGKIQYDVLTGTQYEWIGCSNRNIPGTALVGGRISGGEILYIGRACHNGNMQLGKIHPSHGCLYFSYHSGEISVPSYETFIRFPRPSPRRTKRIQSKIKHPLSDGAHEGGYDMDFFPIYIGRSIYEGNYLPVNIVPLRKNALLTNEGKTLLIENYEVLCEGSLKWVKHDDGTIPEGDISTGETKSGTTLYIGHGYYMGSLTVGKTDPTTMILYIPFVNSEIDIQKYEFLIKT